VSWKKIHWLRVLTKDGEEKRRRRWRRIIIIIIVVFQVNI
jgi:hypothetical protein